MSPKTVGSPTRQNYDLQADAPQREGCDRTFSEKLSGASKHRPEYEKMLDQLRSGDEVVVWDIDRLGRTTLELIRLIDEWNAKGIRFKSTSQPLIDTTTPHGEFIFQLFAILSQHERKRLILRTKASLESARARGRMGGRKRGLSARYDKIAPLVRSAYGEGRSIREIMQAFSIPSSATVHKIVSANRQTTASTDRSPSEQSPVL